MTRKTCHPRKSRTFRCASSNCPLRCLTFHHIGDFLKKPRLQLGIPRDSNLLTLQHIRPIYSQLAHAAQCVVFYTCCNQKNTFYTFSLCTDLFARNSQHHLHHPRLSNTPAHLSVLTSLFPRLLHRPMISYLLRAV